LIFCSIFYCPFEEVFMSVTVIESVAQKLKSGLESVILGQSEAIELLLVGFLSEGHMLLEGIPGTAKTTMVKCLAQLAGLEFKRIQLTPDMLPSEIVGTSLYDLNARNFTFRKGPVFTDILLADEINRTPPKTQSALLEAMEEHQISADGTRYALSPLFTTIATLNPIEFEGTYPLPEAQLDRFMLKIKISYPPQEAERALLKQFSQEAGTRFLFQNVEKLSAVTNAEEIQACRKALSEVTVQEEMLDYILGVVLDTRQNLALSLGSSPRAALSLMAASRAHAAIQGQQFVSPDNVKAVAQAVLRHRIMLSPEAELDGLTTDHVIQQTLNKVPVPR
jgi:MoxR-like ATPase